MLRAKISQAIQISTVSCSYALLNKAGLTWLQPFIWSNGNALVSGAGGLKFKSRARQIGTFPAVATAATFFRKKLCCRGAMTQRWTRILVTRFGVIQ